MKTYNINQADKNTEIIGVFLEGGQRHLHILKYSKQLDWHYTETELKLPLNIRDSLVGFIPINDTHEVSRVEVIGRDREYTNYNAKNVELSFQDNNRTLKIFLDHA